ncbi:MAG: bifunctional methionine sulfoxide reductase B/A protein [Planctomycetes bacterium]|nr:bifunctional methionine sulfoxide reductase B/A protein [Planctomycetota bacterium]
MKESTDNPKNAVSNHGGSYQCGLPQSDEELKKILTPEQYRIIRENGTERPFDNAYWNNKHPGLYVDVISGEPLFSSREKFDSGSGWPSFTEPIKPEAIKKHSDRTLGMIRTEVRSEKSDAHLGHVFDDGPGPKGLRYCINSASLRFIPVENLENEGYGEYKPLFEKNDAANQDKEGPLNTQTATFGAGCFWGVESAFQSLKGVTETAVGYLGGTMENPTYKDVCSGDTGHAEVVQVKYDPNLVSYEELLELFWKIHDPTTMNRQGPDVGAQYRSAVFFHSPEQEKAAKAMRDRLQSSGRYKRDIVTEITPASTFYRAEDYHQKYLQKRGKSSCHLPE